VRLQGGAWHSAKRSAHVARVRAECETMKTTAGKDLDRDAYRTKVVAVARYDELVRQHAKRQRPGTRMQRLASNLAAAQAPEHSRTRGEVKKGFQVTTAAVQKVGSAVEAVGTDVKSVLRVLDRPEKDREAITKLMAKQRAQLVKVKHVGCLKLVDTARKDGAAVAKAQAAPPSSSTAKALEVKTAKVSKASDKFARSLEAANQAVSGFADEYSVLAPEWHQAHLDELAKLVPADASVGTGAAASAVPADASDGTGAAVGAASSDPHGSTHSHA
jgi:hypothetical protein